MKTKKQKTPNAQRPTLNDGKAEVRWQKTNKLPSSISHLLAALALLCATIGPIFTLTGCETTGKLWKAATTSVSEQTATTLIVSAEKATQIGRDTIDTFVRLEYEHRDQYAAISPKIHEFAERLRADANHNGVQDGIDILITARVATKAFKANRTANNEVNLRSAYATLQSVLADCKKYSSLALNTAQPSTSP